MRRQAQARMTTAGGYEFRDRRLRVAPE